MSLSSDIINKGRITICSDTPEQTERAAQLKAQPGYPAFVDIVVTYDRDPAPKSE